MVQPAVGWTLLHQLIIKIVPPQNETTGQEDPYSCSVEAFLQVTLGYVTMTGKANQDRHSVFSFLGLP